jgi:DNA-binding SARP family transcriptional activator
MRSDEVVGADQIVRELWHNAPPRRAVAGVQNYISRLRATLSPFAHGIDPIVTHRRGYQLRFGPADDSDLHNFVRLLNEGRSHFLDNRHELSLSSLERALALWRGPVLGGQRAGPIVSSVTSWLTAARAECAELAAEARELLLAHGSLRAAAEKGGFDVAPDDEGDRSAPDGVGALHGADPAVR